MTSNWNQACFTKMTGRGLKEERVKKRGYFFSLEIWYSDMDIQLDKEGLFKKMCFELHLFSFTLKEL